MFCEVCSKDASARCSGCKTVWYCSPKCQQADWKGHKRTCKVQQKLDEIVKEHEKREAEKPQKRPDPNRCTGCNTKFRNDDSDYECDQECEACGYKTCMDCSSSSSRGTCYCLDSNFGDFYCVRDPKWYHGNGRTGAMYRGDMHPEPDRRSYQYPEEVWEVEPRECGTCGQVRRMLKTSAALEYARTNM